MAATVQDAVRLLQDALAAVQERAGGQLGLRLTRAEVALELEAVKSAGAELEFKVFGIGASAGAKGTWSDKHSIKLQLSPAPMRAALGRAPSDDLADAIIALAADAKAVKAQVSGQFVLGEFELTVSFGFTAEGKAAVILGGEASAADSHAITLTFLVV